MARLNDRGGRDAAGFGPYHRPDADLVPLRELDDWQLSKGEPDIRGWEVRTVSGRTIGTVRDLLVDRHTREVVLLDLDLTGGERRARAPLRSAQIDRVTRVIRMDSADLIGGDVTASDRADEARGERVIDRPVTAAADVGDRDRSERDRELEDRERSGVDRGEAGIDSRRTAEERLADGGIDETVVERRPVVYEEVVVRRRNVDADAADAPRDATRRDGTPDERI